MSIGTRKPSPIGPRIPLAAAGRLATVRYSPLVPLGAVEQAVIEEAAVLVPGDAQGGRATSGLDITALTIWATA